MSIPFLNNIVIDDSGHLQFKTAAGLNAGKINQDGNNLVLTNAVGDVLLGDGSSDIYIGDGVNNVDIIFEQSGAIKGHGSSSVTLTLGGANTTLNLENPNINGSVTLPTTTINSKMTFGTANGYILFDYEPSGDTGEYATEVPLLKVDLNGAETTILSRISEYRGVALGADDTVWLRAGDTTSVIKTNVNLSAEQVVMSAEGGFIAYGFPENNTAWSNRVEFQFRTDSGTASQNGLYIGDGGKTQFIDLSRNLKNIGTISSGAITSTKVSTHVSGNITAANAHLDLYNSWTSNTDQKGSIITFTDNYYDGSNYNKTTRAAIKGGTDTTGNTADGYLEFYTDSGDANSPTLALRLDNDQNAAFAGTVQATSLDINGTSDFNSSGTNLIATFTSTDAIGEIRIADETKYTRLLTVGTLFKIMPNDGSETLILDGSDDSATFAGNIVMAANATVDGVDISALPTTFAPTNAEQNVQSDWNATSGDAQILNKPNIPTSFNNLNAVDDRDIAPEDLTYNDDFRIYFADKGQIEGGSNTSDYQDLLVLNSYTDSTGGDANALAFDKNTFRILHYQADQADTNWGTAKQIAYTDEIPTDHTGLYLPIGGGSLTGDLLPNADSSYDIGSNASKWAEGHFDHLYVGETANNPRIDIYTENGTASLADTFEDTSTDKSYIYFNAGTNSNDPGFIMHETSESSSPDERNEGVLHLVPSDDNGYGDYVSIHGTNDADAIKLHTNGRIETAADIQLDFLSGSGSVKISDSLDVTGSITVAGTVDGVDISGLPTSFAPTDAEANVQADWTETTTTSDAFILNKPSTFPPSTHNHDGRYLRTHTRYSDDLDTITTSGVYIWDVSEADDEPTGASDGLLTIKYWDSTSWATASFQDFHANKLYIKSKQSNTWQTDWAQVWTTDQLTTTNKTNYDTAYTHSQAAHAPTDAEANVYSTASELLTAIKTVDGSGSGLDADKLDNYSSSAFARKAETNPIFTGGLSKKNSRYQDGVTSEYPLGHYAPGETLFEIDPTWDEEELKSYFNSTNVSWATEANAPGGYSIYINGNVGVGSPYSSGVPLIPIDEDATYYQECWIKNAGSGQTHYMGSADLEADRTAPDSGLGNPGSYGYWVMSNQNPTTTWTKVSGYITGHHASNTGAFETNATYFSPLALFNWGAGTGTRACYISGWKIIRVDKVGDRIFQDDVQVKGKLEIHTLDTNTSSATALVMNSNEVEKRDLGSLAFSNATIPSGNSIIDWTTDQGTTNIHSGNYTDTNTNQLTTFQVEDGDGTEVTISHGKEWKFLEGQGINVNWTDTNSGADADPYDLQFALKANGVRANELNVSGDGTAGQYLASDADGSFSWVTPPTIPSGNAIIDWTTDQGTTNIHSGNYTDTNTWNANSLNVAGYVAAPGAVANKVWKTDASGNPAWRDDSNDTDFVSKANGGQFDDFITIKEDTNGGTTTGKSFLTLHNENSDIAQQQSFIDFKFTDTNANYTPQVRIGAQVGPDANADNIDKEGAGSFVVYTSPVGNNNAGGSTGLAEQFRVSHNGTSTFGGNIVMAANATVDGVDISALPTTFAPTNAEQNVQSDWNATSGDALILNKPSIPAASGKGGNFDYVQSNLPSSDSTYRGNFGAGVWAYSGYSTGSDRPFTYDATLQVMPTANLGFEISTGWHSTGEGKIKIRALRDCCEGWGSYYDVWTSANFTPSSFISATSADTASELITFSKGISSDGDAKFYNWRALDNTSTSTDFCHRIARITGTQSTRFVIEIAGRQSSYSDNSYPAFGKIVGQLNNDNNYDITFYNFTIGTTVEAVLEVGQLDVNTTQTDIYIRHGQYAELTATAHISDGTITTYSNDSGSTSTPVGYVQSSEVEVWNSSNDGSGSGMDADYVDGLHASSFIRSDADDTASGTYTFTGSAKFALDSTFANSEVRLPATTNQNPTMMFYRPTGAAATSYPWRFQAGGGGTNSSFYIGTGSAANNGSETISNKITISSVGDLTAAGDVIAYSDAKLKENVKTLDGSKVLQMRGVSFDRKDTGESSSGVIAQEIQKVAPELVSDNDGTLGVAYGNLTGYLIEAIKDLKAEVEQLKKQIK